ncbi:protein-L-isoaspartate O-methyltransferase [Candidatus Micrarchaeota archaeon]|nr:protein-L-isoaspartate O-methyltransferase [Candidatus Micrarchaeota archaeon]MBD3418349.1 protein-L-isoaspartate O-methyltransferase [Candidatus Micrarchaeota archaeon]
METNEEMVDYLLRTEAIDERIAECMLRFPRADFLPVPQKKHAYEDTPTQISNNQTTSAPSMVGIMLREAEISPGMNILEVGTGSGWQTALLSCLAGEKGKVYTLDIFKEIFALAEEELRDFPNVTLLLKDGVKGHPEEAPYDRIIVSAAASEPYPELISQLKEGGILIIPLRSIYFQALFKITKTSRGTEKKEICPVLFVPMYEGGASP